MPKALVTQMASTSLRGKCYSAKWPRAPVAEPSGHRDRDMRLPNLNLSPRAVEADPEGISWLAGQCVGKPKSYSTLCYCRRNSSSVLSSPKVWSARCLLGLRLSIRKMVSWVQPQPALGNTCHL